MDWELERVCTVKHDLVCYGAAIPEAPEDFPTRFEGRNVSKKDYKTYAQQCKKGLGSSCFLYLTDESKLGAISSRSVTSAAII